MDHGRGALAKSQSHKKRRGTAKVVSAHSNSVSVNALKSKIRDVSRVLEHAQDLPLDVRIEKERALAGYRQDLEKAQNEKERQRMIKKYHMVRFFERQKATRSLKKLRTRLASTTPNSPENQALENQVHCAEVDLNYTMYHPLTEKYIGLFPRQETQNPPNMEGSSIKISALPQENKPAMWKVVESCMEDGTLQALRDGSLRSATALPIRPAASTKTSHRNVSKKRQEASKAGYSGTVTFDKNEDQSDGGFFEE
ncbi:MAG: hypothetical protein Q9225_007692 [Loekoesia sp. 1 TL-2023]